MAIPNFQDMMLPLLKFLGDGKDHNFLEAEDYIAKHFKLSDDEQRQQKPSGGEALFHNRLHWAKFYLKKAGLVENQYRSKFKITGRGLDVMKKKPSKIDIKYLQQFQEFAEFVHRKRK
ncbi:MAG: winged helix-turn-helix domain-containing protein [Thaumarchaeota archaeon]|nr:winged helix-turn-helix domain-containing protein [Nitrososphaerota archaeon]MBI3641979.1 winged helix-turn-helix domain-containing protein [Nitrososphaerota archaeon]